MVLIPMQSKTGQRVVQGFEEESKGEDLFINGQARTFISGYFSTN
jgi:hypothetical protein